MSKFYVIGKFSREYIKAMMQNPDQDRVPSVKKMMEAIGVTYHSMEIVRGDYDVVGILEGDYEPVAGMKVAVMQSGMMDELILLDTAFNLNATANKAKTASEHYTKTID